MNFDLNDEQRAIQDTAHRFAEGEVRPKVKEESFKRDLVTQMGQMGFFACAFPDNFGGTEAGFLAHSVVCEEISRVDSGAALPFQPPGHDRALHHHGMGHARGAPQVRRGPHQRPAPGLHLFFRTQRRLGHIRHRDAGRGLRGPLPDQRRQDLDIERHGG